MKSFPPLDFMFSENALYRWFPEDYFIFEKRKDEWCIGMEYLANGLLLGGVFMRNYDIYFDKVHSQIKFVRAQCNEDDHISTFEKHQRKGKEEIKDEKEQTERQSAALQEMNLVDCTGVAEINEEDTLY